MSPETRPRPRVAVVMPAYNAEKTLERTYADVPKGDVDDIILVDDRSRDRTVEIARKLGIHVVAHDKNRGYGGNQKTCYRAAIGAISFGISSGSYWPSGWSMTTISAPRCSASR